MSKVLFVPFSMLGGFLAGTLGKKLFELLWGLVDDEKAPDPQYREISLKKLIPALILEGAIFRAVRGLFDHGTRQVFRKLTGSWPGDERPDPA